MTAVEFTAWLEGVAAALGGKPPSQDLWNEVVAKARGIAPSSPHVFWHPTTPQPPFYMPSLPFEVTC